MTSLIDKVEGSKFFIFLDQLAFRIQKNSIFPVAGQLAYFLILSIFPFIMVLLNIISQTSFVQEEALFQLLSFLPTEVYNIFVQFVNEVVESSSQGLLSLAAILAIWSASSGTRAVIRAINDAYGEKEDRSFLSLIVLSVVFTLIFLILIILVFATLVFGEIITKNLFNYLGQSAFFTQFWRRFRIIILLAYMIFTFALLYKFSPVSKEKITLKSTLPGAGFATVGWIIVSLGFSFYVNNFGNFSVTYGSLVGVIILLTWLYLSSIIVLIGGEINASLDFFRLHGFKIHPKKSLVSQLNNKVKERST